MIKCTHCLLSLGIKMSGWFVFVSIVYVSAQVYLCCSFCVYVCVYRVQCITFSAQVLFSYCIIIIII